MIITAIVFCCLVLFVILCKQLEERVNKVVGYQRQTHERISQIEAHEDQQDAVINSQGAALNRQSNAIKGLRSDLNEMGKDVGWKDDNRRTLVMKQKDKDPDDAA